MSAERIQALPRIVAACEAQLPAGARHGAQARAAADEINHLLGAVKSDEYAGTNGANLDISPDLLAALIRAAKGERILIGRLLFNPAAIDYRAAARPRTPARDLEGAAGLGVLRAGGAP